MSTKTTMTLKERVEKASELISSLPEAYNNSKEAFLTEVLSNLGIYDDEVSIKILQSDDFEFGDLAGMIERLTGTAPGIIPMPRKRAIYNTLVNGVSPSEESYVKPKVSLVPGDTNVTEKIVDGIAKAMKTIGQWKDLELLEAYSQECEQEVIDEIEKRVKGRQFIIFSNENENIIDIDASHKLMKKARRKDTPKMFIIDGKQKKLYAPGEFPSVVEIECPLNPGILLFDWYCDTCNQSFEGIEYEVMQFIRVIKECGFAPERGRDIKAMLETARKGLDAIKEDYPECVVHFEELKEVDGLPSLKKRTSSSIKDPLFAGSRNKGLGGRVF